MMVMAGFSPNPSLSRKVFGTSVVEFVCFVLFHKFPPFCFLAAENVPPSAISLIGNVYTPVYDQETSRAYGVKGSVIGELSGEDINCCQTLSYHVTGGDLASKFAVDGNKLVIAVDDLEGSNIVVLITASDGAGGNLTASFTIYANVSVSVPDVVSSTGCSVSIRVCM